MYNGVSNISYKLRWEKFTKTLPHQGDGRGGKVGRPGEGGFYIVSVVGIY